MFSYERENVEVVTWESNSASSQTVWGWLYWWVKQQKRHNMHSYQIRHTRATMSQQADNDHHLCMLITTSYIIRISLRDPITFQSNFLCLAQWTWRIFLALICLPGKVKGHSWKMLQHNNIRTWGIKRCVAVVKMLQGSLEQRWQSSPDIHFPAHMHHKGAIWLLHRVQEVQELLSDGGGGKQNVFPW